MSGPNWPNWRQGADSRRNGLWPRLLDFVLDGCGAACCSEVFFWFIFGLVVLVGALIVYRRH